MAHSREPHRPIARRGPVSGGRLASAVIALAWLVSACGGSAGDGSAASGSGSGSPALAHANGATDVVLRLDEGGGDPAAPMFLAIQPPSFTLYGDGKVLFRDLSHATPPKRSGTVTPLAPFRITRITEAQIQALLASALGDGGLGSARPAYPDSGLQPIPNAVFTIRAGGVQKTVSVVGLDVSVSDGPDVLARRAFLKLAQRLRNFDGDGTVAPGDAWASARYRGLLLTYPGDGTVPSGAMAWPWADLQPSDFVSTGGPNAPGLHVLTDEMVRALGVENYIGGFQGLALAGPGDGKTYALQLRPLLLDERE